MFKQLLFTALAMTLPSLSEAKTIDLGHKLGDGSEMLRVSIIPKPGLHKIRIQPLPSEILCKKFRPDLCGKENDVLFVEINVDAEKCRFLNEKLWTCNIGHSSKPNQSVVATLNNGTTIDLPDVMGMVKVFEVKTAEPSEAEAETEAILEVQILGHRPDGLDPIIQMIPDDSIFLETLPLEIMSTSLFDL